MTTRVTEGARGERHGLVSRVSRLRRLTLARAYIPLTKTEEKERLLAVFSSHGQLFHPCRTSRNGIIPGKMVTVTPFIAATTCVITAYA